MDVVGSSPENRHFYIHTPALDGYEITTASWGYLIERAGKLNFNLTSELSRMPSELVDKLRKLL